MFAGRSSDKIKVNSTSPMTCLRVQTLEQNAPSTLCIRDRRILLFESLFSSGCQFRYRYLRMEVTFGDVCPFRRTTFHCSLTINFNLQWEDFELPFQIICLNSKLGWRSYMSSPWLDLNRNERNPNWTSLSRIIIWIFITFNDIWSNSSTFIIIIINWCIDKFYVFFIWLLLLLFI